jgi:hypothetical protein
MRRLDGYNQKLGSAWLSLPPILSGAIARANPVISSVSTSTPQMVASPDAG